MNLICTVLSVLALLPAPGWCFQEPPEDPVAEKLAALLAEHEQSELNHSEAYHAFRPRFTEFALTHRGTESEVRAMLWLVQGSWWLRSDGEMESTSMPLAEDLLTRHPDSPQLGLLIEYDYVFKKKQREPLFERLLKVSPHREVRAAALFGLAQEGPARLDDGSPNPHFAAILADYADVPWRATTFGSIADAYLNPLSKEDLAVGQVAPEIVGTDQDGKPLKLSDFRGKVVLLDFWGDW